MSLLVMKFGGASVKSTCQFKYIANIIQQRQTQFNHIVVTVSAMGAMTDELLTMSHQVNTNPSEVSATFLLATQN